uniref:Secreted protein n=1 Tax=Octopus bimaculoides TaxID=37653 RepID=A0A0L8GBX3_OCTBM
MLLRILSGAVTILSACCLCHSLKIKAFNCLVLQVRQIATKTGKKERSKKKNMKVPYFNLIIQSYCVRSQSVNTNNWCTNNFKKFSSSKLTQFWQEESHLTHVQTFENCFKHFIFCIFTVLFLEMFKR